MNNSNQATIAFSFQFKGRTYLFQLNPLSLFLDGKKIEKLKITGKSNRRLQDSQLKVLSYLLENTEVFHTVGTIAQRTNLSSSTISTHIRYLRVALDDLNHPPELIKNTDAKQHEGKETRYGLFVDVERITHPKLLQKLTQPKRTRRKLFRAIVGWLLIIISFFGFYFVIRKYSGLYESLPWQITYKSAGAPVRAIAISSDGARLAYAEKTGKGEETIGKLYEKSDKKHSVIPALRNSEIFRLSWIPHSTSLLVSGKLGRDRTGGIWLVPDFIGSTPPVSVPTNQGETGEAAAMDFSHIAFVSGNRNQIWLTGMNGQRPRLILKGNEGDQFNGLVWLAGGKLLLFNRLNLAGARYQITVETLDLTTETFNPAKRETSIIIKNDPRLRAGCASPEGHIYYALEDEPSKQANHKDTSLWTMRIDPETGKIIQKATMLIKSNGSNVHGLSTTADGNQLAILKGAYQADVWITDTDIDQTTGMLSNPKRLTKDDSDELPTAWTPDSTAIYFHSNVSGKYAIYKQNIDPNNTTIEKITNDEEDSRGARIRSDGKTMFYLSLPGGLYQNKLKTSSPPGENPQIVYEKLAYLSMRCDRSSKNLCVMSERGGLSLGDDLIFRDLARLNEQNNELTRIKLDLPDGHEYWDLSPDGEQLAVITGGDPDEAIHLLGLKNSTNREIKVKGCSGFQSIDWAPDGRGWYISSRSARSADLLYIDLQGNSKVIWKSADGYETWGVPSPDGKHLAMLEWTAIGNIWIADNLPKQSSLNLQSLFIICIIVLVSGLTLIFWGQISVFASKITQSIRHEKRNPS